MCSVSRARVAVVHRTRIGAARRRKSARMGTNRLESFSDGVIAVAITLLVLAIVPPALHDGRAQPDLRARQGLAALRRLRHLVHDDRDHLDQPPRDDQRACASADHSILILNLLLLMTIAILPFATDLMATYLPRRSRPEAGRRRLRRLVPAHVGGLLRAQPPHPARPCAHAVRPRSRSRSAAGSSRARSRAGALPDRHDPRGGLGLPHAGHLRRPRPLLRAAHRERRQTQDTSSIRPSWPSRHRHPPSTSSAPCWAPTACCPAIRAST